MRQKKRGLHQSSRQLTCLSHVSESVPHDDVSGKFAAGVSAKPIMELHKVFYST
jgi:hypothetical protein